MPMQIHDVNPDNHPDYSNHVECPRCGCNSCEIVEYPSGSDRTWGEVCSDADPRNAVWLGWGGGGKARCNHCYWLFSVRGETDEEKEEREGFW